MMFLLALLIVVIGMVPTFIVRPKLSWLGIIWFPIVWFICYKSVPAMVLPVIGTWSVLVTILILWAITAIVEAIRSDYSDGKPLIPTLLFFGLALFACLYLFFGSTMLRSNDYASLIGTVEKREWTQDVQPKDPRHVRLVTAKNAKYLAGKQLGEAEGAIGSQFEIGELTLQLINNELWYVAPLDFKGFSVWTTAKNAPGYVMVHGEDPKHPVVVKTGYSFRYTPGAWFGDNLERHIQAKYIGRYALKNFCLEIDDKGEPWWVVTAYKPSIVSFGPKVAGVIIVDPKSGSSEFYEIGKTPDWVDRVIPAEFVKAYVDDWGHYSDGWLNSFWGHKNLKEAEDVSLVYGSDGRPQWVTGLTSVNYSDASLIGLMYTDARTGKSVEYRASGGTEAAVLQLVNNKVQYQKLHGDGPMLYNIYGHMTSIVPLLGESDSFQGVAMVDVANMQLAVGDDAESAFKQYQKVVMTGSSQTLAPDKSRALKRLEGVISRIAKEQSKDETIYYIYLEGVSHLFSGATEISPKLKMALPGDYVSIGYVDSKEAVIPLMTFDLPDLILQASSIEVELNTRVAERVKQNQDRADAKSARGEIQNMSDTEIAELLKLRRK